MISDINESVHANGIFMDHQPTYDKVLNSEIALQLDKKVVAG